MTVSLLVVCLLMVKGMAAGTEFSLWLAPDGTVLLQGRLPNTTRTALMKIAQGSLAKELRIVDYIKIDRNLAAPRWSLGVAAMLPELVKDSVERTFSVGDGLVKIVGVVKTAEDKERIDSILSEHFPQGRYRVTNGIKSEAQIAREKEIRKLLEDATGGKTGLAALQEIVKTTAVYFGSQSAKIGDSEKPKLNLLWAAFSSAGQDFPDNLVIQGFTDAKGSAGANAWWREERCKSVRLYLKGKGISPDRMEIDTTSISAPKPRIVGDEGEEKDPGRVNRRVELRIGARTGPSGDTAVESTEEPVANTASTDPGDTPPEPADHGESGAEDRPASDSTSTTPIPVDVPAPGAEETEPAAANSAAIFFSSGSTWIKYTEREKLKNLLKAWESLDDKRLQKFNIIGYADSTGDPEINAWLRKHRCKSVFDFLASEGLRKDLMTIDEREDVAPKARIVGGETDTGKRSASRRVDVRIVGAGDKDSR